MIESAYHQKEKSVEIVKYRLKMSANRMRGQLSIKLRGTVMQATE